MSALRKVVSITVMGRTYNSVFGLIPIRRKIEIMLNCMITTLIHCSEYDLYVKFTPSFLLNSEWWVLESWFSIITVNSMPLLKSVLIGPALERGHTLSCALLKRGV